MGCKKGGGGKKKILFGALTIAIAAAFVPAITALAEQTTLLSSAVRTTSTNSADVVKGSNYRGVHVNMQVSVISGANTITPIIQGKDAEGNYYDLLQGAATLSTGTNIIKVYPGAVAVPNAIASDGLPDVWRVRISHSSAIAPFTYSVNYNTLQ